MPATNDRATRTNRKDDAIEREAARTGRPDADQIAVLDARLGKGKGARKERSRLAAA